LNLPACGSKKEEEEEEAVVEWRKQKRIEKLLTEEQLKTFFACEILSPLLLCALCFFSLSLSPRLLLSLLISGSER